jgi:hypothetical protein
MDVRNYKSLYQISKDELKKMASSLDIKADQKQQLKVKKDFLHKQKRMREEEIQTTENDYSTGVQSDYDCSENGSQYSGDDDDGSSSDYDDHSNDYDSSSGSSCDSDDYSSDEEVEYLETDLSDDDEKNSSGCSEGESSEDERQTSSMSRKRKRQKHQLLPKKKTADQTWINRHFQSDDDDDDDDFDATVSEQKAKSVPNPKELIQMYATIKHSKRIERLLNKEHSKSDVGAIKVTIKKLMEKDAVLPGEKLYKDLKIFLSDTYLTQLKKLINNPKLVKSIVLTAMNFQKQQQQNEGQYHEEQQELGSDS